MKNFQIRQNIIKLKSYFLSHMVLMCQERCFLSYVKFKKAKQVGGLCSVQKSQTERKNESENAVAMAAAMAACVQWNRCALRCVFDSGKAAV